MRIDQERAASWGRDEVLTRWTQMFTGPLWVQRYLAGEELTESTLKLVDEWVDTYRERLCDLSWFMRVLNESIAREANKEDGVKGRFWEGRFKSQALLDEQAILSAMAYVDLNPIRAGIAETPEQSEHTSIKARLDEVMSESAVEKKKQEPETKHYEQNIVANSMITESQQGETEVCQHELSVDDLINAPKAPLLPFDGTARQGDAIPFAWPDYLELIDTVGRIVHPLKKGRIPDGTPGILQRLDIDLEEFIEHADRFLKEFGTAVGTPARLVELARHRQARYLRGIRAARKIFDCRAA